MKKILSTILSIVFLTSPLSAAAQDQSPSRFSLFRLYNAASHDRLYTSSLEEIARAEKLGYVLEATYNSLSSRVLEEDQLPLYRLYQPKTGKHFYTDSNDEMTALVARRGGYLLEGVLGYLAGTSFKTGTPIFRLYHPSTGGHLYTPSWVEWGMLQLSGWKDEGKLRGRLY